MPPWYRGPLFYPKGEMMEVIFTPTAESLRKVLPEPLQPGLLGGAYVARFPESPFGPMWEASVVVQCLYKEHFGIYFLAQYSDLDVSVAAHREIWGFPTKQAQIKFDRKGDQIKAKVIRKGTTIIELQADLEGPGEWIDTGAAINIKVIPNVDGKTYDVTQITAANLEFKIYEGFAGSGKIKLGKTDDDLLADMIDLENVVAGTFFTVDLTCPYGKVIGEIKL